jgi:hypothetical protein
MTPVKSSNIKAVGYSPDSKTLTVQFHSGAVHAYEGVDPVHHENMLKCADNGESVGSYFHRQIRMGGYKASKVETETDE